MIEGQLNIKLFNLKTCALLSNWGKPIITDYRALTEEKKEDVYQAFFACINHDGFYGIIQLLLPTAEMQHEYAERVFAKDIEIIKEVKIKIRNYLQSHVGGAYANLIKTATESDEIKLGLDAR